MVADSRTGESNTANKTKYASIQETFLGDTFNYRKINKDSWTYIMVDFLNILVSGDPTVVHNTFIWRVEDSTLYLLYQMNAFTN